MKNNNNNLLAELAKNRKQVIQVAVIIFVTLIIYKYISSSIQENKEKAVLQRKYDLEQQAKEPLNQCLADVDAKMKVFSNLIMGAYKDINKPGARELCESINNKQGGCTMTLSEALSEIELQRQKFEPEKQNCYKQYK